jgi:hypothetical protein
MAIDRRQFLEISAAAAAGAVASGAAVSAETRPVAVIVDPGDPVAGSPVGRWAARELVAALAARGVATAIYSKATDAPAGSRRIVASGLASAEARAALAAAGARPAAAAEVLAICQTRDATWACGHDARGLAYALLELADRARLSADPIAPLAQPQPIVEAPANRVRSITRLFTSEVEDKPWFDDREMWPAYLTMLAAQRFNRFNLALGIGYDFLTNVTDAYFVFSYPFLLAVPGYDVRVPQISDAERDRNLDTLRFIARETVARGLEFRLGLWMHGYVWNKSPNPKHTIEGLTAETHGPYCREAIRLLLQQVPEISGVTLRVHGESGVEEGSYQFWKMVFEGVASCGRTVEIDMHSKGMDQTMIETALAAGPPVTISPKFWAEHLGLPYHQADIREQERPKPGREATGLMKLSAGSRSFTRYGYGDLLREDRTWDVVHRIWPGTQRLLVWGDPLFAAAYSRAFSFCGSAGVEIMEPLSFKGRRGSGIAGNRCAYLDATLAPRWDWQKYAQTYRVWGRLLYDPDTAAEVTARALRHDVGPAGDDLGAALASASRILPTVTTAHLPSAANNLYWPEIYTNQSLVDPAHDAGYTDMPQPRVFGNVSPLDPQLFYRVNDFADDLLKGERSGKYTPIEVATWLEGHAEGATRALARANRRVRTAGRPDYRRLAIDIAVAADLGRFFAAKLRAGVLYRIFEQTGDAAALDAALGAYRRARDAWAAIVARTKDVYVSDITVGELRVLRGHWADRLAAIDEDLAAVAATKAAAKPVPKPVPGGAPSTRAIAAALDQPTRPALAAHHTAPASYAPDRPLPLVVTLERDVRDVRLHYRAVNQAERWQSLRMQAQGRAWAAEVPAEALTSPYPLAYYFEVAFAGGAGLYPGLGPATAEPPYVVVRRARA